MFAVVDTVEFDSLSFLISAFFFRTAMSAVGHLNNLNFNLKHGCADVPLRKQDATLSYPFLFLSGI